MSGSIDDLLGPPPEPASRDERRLRAAEALAKETAIKAAGRGGTFVDQGVLKRPVSQNFLADADAAGFTFDEVLEMLGAQRSPKDGGRGGA